MTTRLSGNPVGGVTPLVLSNGPMQLCVEQALITEWEATFTEDVVDLGFSSGFQERAVGLKGLHGTISFEATGPVEMAINTRNIQMEQAKQLTIRELLTVIHEKMQEGKT